MKVGTVAIILNSMSSFEFWMFMKMPIKKRWKLLRQKSKGRK